ncbi:MAG: iron dependent repressor, metal binding and dimerization domain protein [Phycisphaerales bacterium]
MPARSSTVTKVSSAPVRSLAPASALVAVATPPRAEVKLAPVTVPAAVRFQRVHGTKTNGTSETSDSYLEVVAQVILEAGEARVSELAKAMGMSQGTVSKTVARLAERRLVNAPASKPITLTPAGKKLAERASERHETVLSFLRKLGVREEQAQSDAAIIEMQVSGATIAAMQRWLSGTASRGNRVGESA